MRTALIALLLFPVFALASDQRPKPAPTPPPGAHGAFVMIDETQLFQVVLLRGSRSGVDDLEGLPKSAEKALADVREFLPFKRYQVLDAALVRLARDMSGGVTVNQYDVRFSYGRKDNKLSIWSFQVLPARKIETPTPPPGIMRGPAYAPEAIKPLISTSFAMDRGETVVVGSSKIDGDEALVVLLTALPGK